MNNKMKRFIREKIWMAIGILGLLLVSSIVVTGYFMNSGKESGQLKELTPVAQATTQEATEKKTQNQVAKKETEPQTIQEEITKATDTAKIEKEREELPVISPKVLPLQIEFTAEDRIGWPVMGNVIQMYSMDTTVWFPTLAQYKVSPGIEIQCEAGSYVACVANSRVVNVGRNEELGNYVEMDMGNGFHAIYAQLKDIEVAPGAEVAAGRIFAKVSEPTRYYTLDGPHLYFEMDQNGKPIDPLDYIK